MLLLPYLAPHIMAYHLHLALVNITNHLGSGTRLPVHWRSVGESSLNNETCILKQLVGSLLCSGDHIGRAQRESGGYQRGVIQPFSPAARSTRRLSRRCPPTLAPATLGLQLKTSSKNCQSTLGTTKNNCNKELLFFF